MNFYDNKCFKKILDQFEKVIISYEADLNYVDCIAVNCSVFTFVYRKMVRRFPDEYESTSSHQLRHPEDMQFAFSYYYYLIDEKVEFNLTKMFNDLDTDMSG